MAIALPFTTAQFQNEIVVSGMFHGGVAVPGGPILRSQAGNALAAGDQNLHFSLTDQTVVSYAPGGVHAPTGGSTVRFLPDSGINRAVFLPFNANNIASAIVPAGVDYFFTDNLSGCAIFIDLMPGGDLLVHHANAMSSCPNMAAILANPAISKADSIGFAGAMNNMSQQHTAAMADRAVGLGGPVIPQAHLHRTTYMQCIDDEVARKEAQGRTEVDHLAAGTNVVGFRVGGQWEFWWQTWAIMKYKRPLMAPKGWFGHRRESGGLGAAKLLDAQCFWRQ
ncbi:MAG: hypothetical protein ABJM61_09960 [Yoonia sp.]|uniref:hypothetical protein n=1 Tax=Yoonia sp. TaxID=2212373 RepID=UPI0032982376